MAILKNEQLGDIGMFYKTYEPKTKNRFYFDIEGVPAYLVKRLIDPNLRSKRSHSITSTYKENSKVESLGETLHVNCMILLTHQVLRQ